MSDEQDPPALSLRPRKKPADDDAAADSSSNEAEAPKLSLKPKTKPVEAPGAVATGEERKKPSLSIKPNSAEVEQPMQAPAVEAAAPEPVTPRAKPKLSIKLGGEEKKEPSAATVPDQPPAESAITPAAKESASEPITPPSAEPSNTEEPVVEHRDETNPALPPALKEALLKAKSEKPKLKLHISQPETSPAPGESPATPAEELPPPPDLPPPPGMNKSAVLPPPVPVVTDELGQSATAPPIPMPVDEDDDDEDDDDSEAPARKRLRPEQRPIFKLVVILIAIALIGAIGAGGYMVYNLLFGVDEFVPPPASVATTPGESAPVGLEISGASSLAGQMIEKAKNAANAIGETTEAVKEAASGFGEDGNEADDALKDAEALVKSPDAASSPEIDSTRVGASETPTATEPEVSEPVVVPPSQDFQNWVSSAVISGVREGSSPRAFINNLLVKQGDTVDARLGITFDSVDAERNLVIFKDRNGAIVAKRY